MPFLTIMHEYFSNSKYYEVTFPYYDEAKYVFVGRNKEMLKTN